MSVRELGHIEGFRVGSVGPLLVSVFVETATLDRLALLERLQTEFVEKAGNIFTLNVVIGRSLRSPGAEVRERAAFLQAKFKQTTLASATVVAVTGLGAVIARSFMAALALVAPDTNPSHVCKTIVEATRWLQSHPKAGVDLQTFPRLAHDIEAFVAATGAETEPIRQTRAS
jgi:hypothetical protein